MEKEAFVASDPDPGDATLRSVARDAELPGSYNTGPALGSPRLDPRDQIIVCASPSMLIA